MSGRKILCAGPLDSGGTAPHRVAALRRLGYEVVTFNFSDYLKGVGRAANWFYHRALLGPAITRLNRDLMRFAETSAPDFVFVEKGVFVWPETVSAISAKIAPTIQYNLDNPFGNTGEPWWRHLKASIPCFDMHFVPRQVNIDDYTKAGAKRVIRVPLAYEPTIHYPPPASWTDADRPIDVSFTGSPYDDRGAFLTGLLTRHGIATDIRGDRWHSALSPEIARAIYKGPGIYENGYRERIWASKICLSFVTHCSCDQMAHKSFEIAGAGGFLLAEATEEHMAAFEPDKEAVFFTDLDDCARLIRKYLADPGAREAIAAAGRRRAEASGYSNDARLRLAFEMVERLFPGAGG